MGEGWISLHRKIRKSPEWYAEPLTKAQAWIDLILMANHKEKMFYIRGNEVRVYRGQIARSERSLSENWGWSRNKTRRFLKSLKAKQQIDHRKSKLINIITIVNYNKYQQNETTGDTTERPQKDQNNNVNNVNNVNKKQIYGRNFEKFWQSYPKKNKKLLAFKAWKKENGNRPDIEIILKVIQEQKDWKAHQIKNKEFCPEWQDPERWIKNHRWEDKTPKKKIVEKYNSFLNKNITEVIFDGE